MILLDTNLLTRITRSRDPQSGLARAAIQTLLGRGERLIVAPQNLYEFWAVATRAPGPPPAGANGLGMTPAQGSHRPGGDGDGAAILALKSDPRTGCWSTTSGWWTLMGRAAPMAKRPCMYCGTLTKKTGEGEHIVPKAIGGARTLNDSSDRAVCPDCNNGVLSQLDNELCRRSFLSIVASQQIDAYLWQAWDIDHAANNLVLEARPLWDVDKSLCGLACYPQIVFDREGGVRAYGAPGEFYNFGPEHFSPVLFKAVGQCFQRHCAGKKRSLHLERVQSGLLYDGCRLAPRVFAPRRIDEIARNINEQSFTLRYVNDDDRRFAFQCMDKLGDGRKLNRVTMKLGSHTPSLCCYFDVADTLRALMKIGLNLIAAYCPNTPVNAESFGLVKTVIKGPVQVWPAAFNKGGFVYAEDVQPIKGAANEHTFRLMYADSAWSIVSSFFGGDIGAYVRLPGPNGEDWNSADIVAPINSKTWRLTTSRILPPMKSVHIEWGDAKKIIPCFKTQYSVSIRRAELVPQKRDKRAK